MTIPPRNPLLDPAPHPLDRPPPEPPRVPPSLRDAVDQHADRTLDKLDKLTERVNQIEAQNSPILHGIEERVTANEVLMRAMANGDAEEAHRLAQTPLPAPRHRMRQLLEVGKEWLRHLPRFGSSDAK